MENQKAEKNEPEIQHIQDSSEKTENESTKSSAYDPLKLLNEAGSLFKDLGSKSVEAFGLPSFSTQKTELQKNQQPDKQPDKKLPENQKQPENQSAAASSKPQENDAKKAAENASKDRGESKPLSQLDKQSQEIADKLIDRIKDTENPVADIKEALKKLDNLQAASVTRNGRSSHIEIDLLSGKSVAPPNIQVRGFRPVSSHIDSHISFDLTPHRGGLSVSNVDGLSSSVRGPLGRIRHSETTSMFIGKDGYGPYINTSSDLHMRRRIHSSTTTLREHNLPADSPMRSMMNHPESLEKVGSMLRLFQNTDDLNKMSIKRSGDAFDVKSEAKNGNHVELNFKPAPETLPVPIPITVKSLDLDKTLSSSLKQGENSVSLENISGLTVNVEIGSFKTSVCPSKVSIEKDMLKMDLKNPEDGQIIPISIPVAKLKEAAARLKK